MAMLFAQKHGLAEKHGLVEKHDGLPEPSDDVRLWLRLLSSAMVVEKRIRRRFANQFDTTLPRFDVLAALDRVEDGLTMSELSRMLLVSNGNVTALVQTLIRDGFAESEVDAADRRVSRVRLTIAGRARFAELATAHREWIQAMLGGMNSGQKARLFALLGELKGSLAKDGA